MQESLFDSIAIIWLLLWADAILNIQNAKPFSLTGISLNFMNSKNTQEDKKLKNIFLITSVILFLLSLTQKCYCTTSVCSDSIMVFLLGWAAIVSGGAGLSWIANPLLLISWLLLRKNLKASMFLSVFAFLLSFSFLLFDSVLDNEAGHNHQIISYRPGYWLWIGSTLCMLVGTFVLMLRHNTRYAS